MTTPCIITVAITGSLPQKSDNPAVPITVGEQVESTHEAFEVGATLVHAHVRKDDGSPTSEPERFARLIEGVRKHCPGMVIQLSTGSCNFPARVYENSPELVDWLAAEMHAHRVKPEIEAFDLSMIFKAVEMEQDGRIVGPLHVQFVMGVKNAMPVDRATFDFYVATLKRLAPEATWTGAGIGRGQITLNRWSLELATAAPASRTTCASTARRSLRPTRRWSSAWSRSPANTTAGPRPSPRHGRF
jgi:3-oxoadipate:acetyl-CoA acetyltransferase